VPTRAAGEWTSAYAPGVRNEMMDRPGASTSRPRVESPRLVKLAAESSVDETVLFVSAAPTAMT
jgi:hypothetical protein